VVFSAIISVTALMTVAHAASTHGVGR
jgi:hypothetical protein